MTTIKNFLNNLQQKYLESPGRQRWNSVATPFTLWPSVYDLKGWDSQPDLKAKRLVMWNFFSFKLKELQIQSSIDIGCASAQFSLLQILRGIEAYGVDPQKFFLFSNEDDFNKNSIDASQYLFLGDLENVIKQIDETPIEVDCISNLNFIHGWDSSDAECTRYFQSLAKVAKYLIFSYPQNFPSTVAYLNSITEEVICSFNAIGIPHETHVLIKVKK
jgi:hypothetical protein